MSDVKISDVKIFDVKMFDFNSEKNNVDEGASKMR